MNEHDARGRVAHPQDEAQRNIINLFYQYFNERRVDEAAALFSDDAVLEHAPVGRRETGGDGYLAFAQMWTRAFPDATLTVERIVSRGSDSYEVDLSAAGTHLGALDMGGCGVFKPTGTRATLRLRQLLQVRDNKITFSSLSFDLQEIVQQLVTIDVSRLLTHLTRLQQLGAKLSATPKSDLIEQRNLVDRLGTELDAARRIVRPYFDR